LHHGIIIHFPTIAFFFCKTAYSILSTYTFLPNRPFHAALHCYHRLCCTRLFPSCPFYAALHCYRWLCCTRFFPAVHSMLHFIATTGYAAHIIYGNLPMYAIGGGAIGKGIIPRGPIGGEAIGKGITRGLIGSGGP